MTGQDDADSGNDKCNPAQGEFGFVVMLTRARAVEWHTAEGL